MPIISPTQLRDGYDVVLVGTGFGSLFFAQRLRKLKPKSKILLIERGRINSRDWQLKNLKSTDVEATSTFHNITPSKVWYFSIGFGGGMNCWWAATPRPHPDDLKLFSKHGVGMDWPLEYADLEPYWEQAETFMGVAGPNDMSKFYGSHKGYKMRAHRLTSGDMMLKRAFPDQHFGLPSARVTTPVGERGACCSSARCEICPTNSKFSWYNGFTHVLEDPNTDILLNSEVTHVNIQNGSAQSVEFKNDGKEFTARGEIVGLGANAIHTPAILLRSGLQNDALGRYLHEKLVFRLEVQLKGIASLDGGTVTTGMNTMFWTGEHRASSSALMVTTENRWDYGLRLEPGRARETMPLTIYSEDLPDKDNTVTVNSAGDVEVRHKWPEYAKNGQKRLLDTIDKRFAGLPIEKIGSMEPIATVNHVQGTCRMGPDEKTSVVDRDLVSHQVRNLLVLGTAVWPSCGVVNPSLTAAALALRAADKMFA